MNNRKPPKLRCTKYKEYHIVRYYCTEKTFKDYQRERTLSSSARQYLHKKLKQYGEYEYNPEKKEYTFTKVYDFPNIPSLQKLQEGIYVYLTPVLLHYLIDYFEPQDKSDIKDLDTGLYHDDEIGIYDEEVKKQLDLREKKIFSVTRFTEGIGLYTSYYHTLKKAPYLSGDSLNVNGSIINHALSIISLRWKNPVYSCLKHLENLRCLYSRDIWLYGPMPKVLHIDHGKYPEPDYIPPKIASPKVTQIIEQCRQKASSSVNKSQKTKSDLNNYEYYRSFDKALLENNILYAYSGKQITHFMRDDINKLLELYYPESYEYYLAELRKTFVTQLMEYVNRKKETREDGEAYAEGFRKVLIAVMYGMGPDLENILKKFDKPV